VAQNAGEVPAGKLLQAPFFGGITGSDASWSYMRNCLKSKVRLFRPHHHGEQNTASRRRCLATTLATAIIRISAKWDSHTPRAVSIAAATYAATTATAAASAASIRTPLIPQGRRSTEHVSPPAPIPSPLAKSTLITNKTGAPVVPIIRTCSAEAANLPEEVVPLRIFKSAATKVELGRARGGPSKIMLKLIDAGEAGEAANVMDPG
jgi:hypothetical protein